MLGGDHGDLPLEEHAGELIATAIVENGFSAVLDLSIFRKGQLIRFMVSFAETLYRLNRHALHLFVDEADAVAPQGRSYGGDENRMLGAMEDIVRRGRKRGIGCTLITQRPAVLNKNVLTQCESLLAMRLVHPADIKAVMEWVNVHADAGQAKEMVESLPTLEIGEGWFWSPGWMGVLKRIKIRQRETFDSSATPKPGEKAKAPKDMAKIDLNALGEQIKATVQRAKETDPKELRRKIAELEKQLRERPATETSTKIVEKEKIIEVPVLKNGQLDKALKLVERMSGFVDKITSQAMALSAAIGEASKPPAKPAAAEKWAAYQSNPLNRRGTKQPVVDKGVAPARVPTGQSQTDPTLTGPEQRILDAIAWFESLQLFEPEQTAVAFLAGYTVGGGAWNNPRGSLNTKGLVQYRGDRIALTEEGRQLSNKPDSPLTTQDLQARVMERLPGPERKILQVLLDSYPNDLAKEELATASGYTPEGGAFNNPLGRLRSMGLAEYPSKGRARARDLLFLS